MGNLMIAISTFASLVVLWTSICTINHMTRRTPITIRAAYILIGVGAAGVLLVPVYFHRPQTPAEMLLIAGTAILGARFFIKTMSRQARKFLRNTGRIR